MANFETKRRCRRLVNDSAFADRKLTGHDWRGHYSITSSAREQRGRNFEAERVRSLQVDRQLVFVGASTGRSAGWPCDRRAAECSPAIPAVRLMGRGHYGKTKMQVFVMGASGCFFSSGQSRKSKNCYVRDAPQPTFFS
jgi:hypothetical protein